MDAIWQVVDAPVTMLVLANLLWLCLMLAAVGIVVDWLMPFGPRK